jgi:hypothetical protein
MVDTLPEFVASVLARENGWVIEPKSQSTIRNFLGILRHIPVSIWHPPGTSRYRFAERGSEGRWFFVWVENK